MLKGHEYYQKLYANNREKELNRSKRYYKNNRDKCKIKRSALKKECFNKYGNHACQCCGESLFEFLTLDHIGGRKRGHIIDTLMGRNLYLWLKNHGYPKDMGITYLSAEILVPGYYHKLVLLYT